MHGGTMARELRSMEDRNDLARGAIPCVSTVVGAA
jgi:hypothetical protein